MTKLTGVRAGQAGRLRWYADRLRAMSSREVLHRVGEAGRKMAWRRRLVGWPDAGRVADGLLPAFPQVRQRLADAAARSDPGLDESLARARSGSFRFLGLDWPPYRGNGDEGFWLFDPVHLGRWPGRETSSFDIDVRSTWSGDRPALAEGHGDVKYVWECNRLQVLHPLAVALAGGDHPAGERALSILRDWSVCNPPYAGVNWVSGIEIAMRLVGIALLCAAAGTDGFAPADRAFLRLVAGAHARHLAAFPSKHSSCNNHRVAEGLGLLIAGLLGRDGGSAWEQEGRTILTREADRQILPDGVGAEQSPTYQAFTMEMLCVGVLLARDVGRPLDASVSDRLASGAAFLVALANEAGAVPAIGDDDEGRVLAQPPDREPRYAASIAAAVAGLTARPDLLPPDWAPHWRDHLFAVSALGPPVRRAHEDGPRIFRTGGYTVAREEIEGRRTLLVFDHGPLGYLKLAAHGHADALGLWLDIDGIPVLTDPGTYLYHSGREKRTILRESSSHSTLSIAGQSQSAARPAFSWASRAESALVDVRLGTRWWVSARHDGYRRSLGVLHERRVAREPSGFAIHDRLVGARTALPVEIRFVIDPTLRLDAGEGAVTVLKGDVPLCRISAPASFATWIPRGTSLSRRFGEIEDGREVVFAGALGAGTVNTSIAVCAGFPVRRA